MYNIIIIIFLFGVVEGLPITTLRVVMQYLIIICNNSAADVKEIRMLRTNAVNRKAEHDIKVTKLC